MPEGVIIIAASINTIKINYYNFIEDVISYEKELPTQDDIGSYFSVMQSIQFDDYNFATLLGSITGEFEIFRIKLVTNFDKNVLPLEPEKFDFDEGRNRAISPIDFKLEKNISPEFE